mgnify:CR=1 FL=1
MTKDQAIGTLLLIAGILGIIIYNYLILAGENIIILGIPADILLLKLTAIIAVTAILAIIAWVGYTLMTTPPPEIPSEIEEEIEKTLEENKNRPTRN